MRDRLIELIIQASEGVTTHCVGDCEFCADKIADHLLSEGVIVPPCKVGSEIYFADHENKSGWDGNVVSFSLDAAHLWFNCHYKCGLNMWHPIEDFGKTVFLTRELAEEALKNAKPIEAL